MTDPASLKIIAGWLMNLADLCRHGAEGRPTKNAVAAYATMLGKNFPPSAFTSDSLHAVMQDADWFPSCAMVQQRLAAWWQDHAPASARALADPQSADVTKLTGIDLTWFVFFRRREAENFGPITIGSRHWPESSRWHLLSLIRQQSYSAWRELIRQGADR